jgi:hypothetical protein
MRFYDSSDGKPMPDKANWPSTFSSEKYDFATFESFDLNSSLNESVIESLKDTLSGLPIDLVFSVDFSFGPNINRYFRILSSFGFRIHIIYNHFNDYDPAGKPYISPNYPLMEKVGDDFMTLPLGSFVKGEGSPAKSAGNEKLISDGAIEMITDDEGKTIVTWWYDMRRDLKVSPVTDLLDCSNPSVIPGELDNPIQLMATNYSEIRGYTKKSSGLYYISRSRNTGI